MRHREMDPDWQESLERLRYVVQRRGVANVAREVPCHRVTLFRMLKGESTPSGPTRECVDRLIDDIEDSRN